MQRAYARARLRGLSQGKAAKQAGYSPKSRPDHVERACVALGLLPDPVAEAEAIKEVVASLTEVRNEGRQWLVEELGKRRQAILDALVRSVEGANVPAIKEALDRYLGPEPTQSDVTSGGLPLGAMTPEEALAIIREAERRGLKDVAD